MTSRRPTKTRGERPSRHLRSETPAGVIQEIYALSLGHFVTRPLMVEAAATVGLDPDRLSFLGCFQILKCRLPECNSSTQRGSSNGIAGCCGKCRQSALTTRCDGTGSIHG